MKRKLVLALLLGVVASWLNVGLSLAHEEELHLGGLSRTATVAVIVVGVLVVGLFVGLFVLAWKRSTQASAPQHVEADGDMAPEIESRDEG